MAPKTRRVQVSVRAKIPGNRGHALFYSDRSITMTRAVAYANQIWQQIEDENGELISITIVPA